MISDELPWTNNTEVSKSRNSSKTAQTLSSFLIQISKKIPRFSRALSTSTSNRLPLSLTFFFVVAHSDPRDELHRIMFHKARREKMYAYKYTKKDDESCQSGTADEETSKSTESQPTK